MGMLTIRSTNTRDYPMLMGILLACPGCLSTQSQSKFDKGFVYGPLMRVAASPDDLLPDFTWANYASETGLVTGGASAGAPVGCPT